MRCALQPRALTRESDTFWLGPEEKADATELDIRDPMNRTYFRLAEGQMDVDNLKVGAATDAPTVSASMATALLAYSGIAVKMLVDERIGAQLANMFMVEYQPGGVALPHDHPLEESYYILEGRDRVRRRRTVLLTQARRCCLGRCRLRTCLLQPFGK